MTILPFRDRGFIRFISGRTGETLFEIKMLDRSIIIWGARYRPSEFVVALADDRTTVSVEGMLCDRIGPVVTFGECLRVEADFRVELGLLPADFDPAWSRDRS